MRSDLIDAEQVPIIMSMTRIGGFAETVSGLFANLACATPRDAMSGVSASPNAIEDEGKAPTLRYFPLSTWEDHTVYTTTDNITIVVSASRVTGSASGAKVEQGTETIHEVVTTTTDSLKGTTTSKVVTASQPGSTSTGASAAEEAAVSGGRAELEAKVTIVDQRTTTEIDYSTTMSENATSPSTSQNIAISTVSDASEDFSDEQTLSFDDPQNTPQVTDAIKALASTYGADSTLSGILTGAYAPRFINETA
jgi:hypothetical protein